MKFSINNRYNGKTGTVLNNQQLKIPYLSEEQGVFNLCFFQLCKNGYTLFFSLGALITVSVAVVHKAVTSYHRIKNNNNNKKL